MADPIPWGLWLRAALTIGVPPHRFWRLSLREWRALTAASAAEAMPRAAFEGLMARFPDDPP
jgi:uncharacterized phage protein (TIGR02216 family)